MPSKETFHFELRDLVCQFEDFLNEIVIRRYNAERVKQDSVKLDLKWGHKQRVLHDIINKQGHITLPLIAVTLGGIKRDKDRVFNKHTGHLMHGLSANYYNQLLQPVPVDITLNISIMTRYQIDMDQILTNFIPYTDPYVVVSWPWPDPITGKVLEIRSAVMWNEDVQMEYPTELQATDALRFMANTSFTLKGWLFKNSDNVVKTIYKIDHSFTAVNRIYDNYKLMQDMEADYNTDTLYISGNPIIYKVSPYFVPVNMESECSVIGQMMDYVSAVYVSGTVGVFPSAEAYFPLAWNSSIWLGSAYPVSAVFGEFTGIMVPTSSWRIVDQTMLIFDMPIAAAPGIIDIILVNEAGYGQLIKDSSSLAPTITSYRYPYETGISAIDLSSIGT